MKPDLCTPRDLVAMLSAASADAGRASGAGAKVVRPGTFSWGRTGIGHQAELRQSKDTIAAGAKVRSATIPAFYDFKALMRSPTSR